MEPQTIPRATPASLLRNIQQEMMLAEEWYGLPGKPPLPLSLIASWTVRLGQVIAMLEGTSDA